jgi:hypothetical protein
MFSVTREDTAAEFPILGNSQMLAFPILPRFSAGRTLRLATAVAQLTQLLQF